MAKTIRPKVIADPEFDSNIWRSRFDVVYKGVKAHVSVFRSGSVNIYLDTFDKVLKVRNYVNGKGDYVSCEITVPADIKLSDTMTMKDTVEIVIGIYKTDWTYQIDVRQAGHESVGRFHPLPAPKIDTKKEGEEGKYETDD